MKNNRKKFEYEKEIPFVLLNWLALGWLTVYILLDYYQESFPPYIEVTLIVCLVVLLLLFAKMCFKGTRARFIVSSTTDSNGWIVRTGKKINYAARKLARSYPILVKTIKLKDSTFKVKITKKYKYHPNPTSVEEVD